MKSKEKLDRRTVKEIERFLNDKRVELKRSVRSVISQRGASDAGRSADSAVLATETLQDEIQVALVDRHSRQVAQIEAALEQLGRREYGICRDCGDFIGVTRLRALPFAQRCRPCQSRAEREEQRESRLMAAGAGVVDAD